MGAPKVAGGAEGAGPSVRVAETASKPSALSNIFIAGPPAGFSGSLPSIEGILSRDPKDANLLKCISFFMWYFIDPFLSNEIEPNPNSFFKKKPVAPSFGPKINSYSIFFVVKLRDTSRKVLFLILYFKKGEARSSHRKKPPGTRGGSEGLRGFPKPPGWGANGAWVGLPLEPKVPFFAPIILNTPAPSINPITQDWAPSAPNQCERWTPKAQVNGGETGAEGARAPKRNLLGARPKVVVR